MPRSPALREASDHRRVAADGRMADPLHRSAEQATKQKKHHDLRDEECFGQAHLGSLRAADAASCDFYAKASTAGDCAPASQSNLKMLQTGVRSSGAWQPPDYHHPMGITMTVEPNRLLVPASRRHIEPHVREDIVLRGTDALYRAPSNP